MYELKKRIRSYVKGARNLVAGIMSRAPLVTSEVVGPPRQCIESTVEWSKGHSNTECCILQKPRSITYELPTRIGGNVHDTFLAGKNATTSEVFIARIKNARVWKDRGPLAVITGGDKVLGDLSKVWGDPTENHSCFEKLWLGKTKKLNGTSLLLATTSGSGYFHWVMDVLPRIKIAKEKYELNKIENIITNEIKYDYQKEWIKKIGIGERKIVQVGQNKHIKCEELIAPSLPRKNGVTQEWAVKYVKSLVKKEHKQNKKIYISREDANRRKVANEEDVTGILKEHGFEKFVPSRHSIEQQAKILSQSTHVVAPHGAGLTNIVYMQEGGHVLEIFPGNNITPCYWQISSLIGAKYYYMHKDKSVHHHIEKFNVPLDGLRQWLQLV